MATAQRLTDPRIRSIALAIAAHLDGTGRTSSTVQNSDGSLRSLTVKVPSRSGASPHMVTYVAATDSARCDCAAAQFHQTCPHAGTALLLGRQVAREFSPAGRAEAARAYQAALAAEGNAAALGY